METILKVQDLVKHFKEIKAVDCLSFSVIKGEIFGLLGPNASGKSTTIRILLSLIKSDSGTIQLFGEPVSERNYRVRKKMGALIERPDFYNYLSAFENLEFLAGISGVRISRKEILEKLEWVGLSSFAKMKVRIFSHGMKQRLGIAQAMLNNPEFLVLDEPANGLDPHGVVDIRNLIMKLSRENGMTILLSSHILKEIELIADSLVVIHRGKSIAMGNMKELLDKNNQYVKISVSNLERSVLILNEHGIKDIRITGPGEIMVHMVNAHSGKINDILVKSGIDVRALIPVFTLEDYYFQLTENALENNNL